MAVTVFLLDKDFTIQAVLNNKISWSYEKAINKATNIKVSIPRQDLEEHSKSNLITVAKYLQVYYNGVYVVGGRITKRDITDTIVDITAFTEEIRMESVICPADYSRKYENWDLADIVRDLDRGWETTRIKSTSQWQTKVDSSNIDFSTLEDRLILEKDAGGVYKQNGYVVYRFLSTDTEGFTSWDRIRWVSDNYSQTDDGVIELVGTTLQYRYGNTVGSLGSWTSPVVGGSPDKLGVDISLLTAPVLEVRLNLHTDDLTSEDNEGNPIGSSPVVFALEVISRKTPYINTTNVPVSTGVEIQGLVANESSAFSILTAVCEMSGWEFEVYNNEIYIEEKIGSDLTETFVFKKNENIKITQLSDDDNDLVNVLHAKGNGSGINRLSITLEDDESISLYGVYPKVVSFDTDDLVELESLAQDYLEKHSSVLLDWRVETFDSIDNTVTNNITVEEGLAFHRIYSTTTFSSPSAFNLVEQNLMFYNPKFRVGDTIRIVDPVVGTINDARILEEKRSGTTNGIKVILYLNKMRDTLSVRVTKPVEKRFMTAPLAITVKPEVNAVNVIVPAPNDKIRWGVTEIFMSETSPVQEDTPIKSSRDTTFLVRGLDPSKRYYFKARYVDIAQNSTGFSREVSCIPTTLALDPQIGLTKTPDNIVVTARGSYKVSEVLIKATLFNITGEIDWDCEGGTVQEVEIEEDEFDNTMVYLDGSTIEGNYATVTASITAGGVTHVVEIAVDKLVIGDNNPLYMGMIDDEIPTTLGGEPLVPGDHFLWVGDYIGDYPEKDPNNAGSTEQELLEARDINAPLSEEGEFIPGRIYAWNGVSWVESRNGSHIANAHTDVIAIAKATNKWFYASVVIAEQAVFENLMVTDGDFKVAITRDGHKDADGKGVPSFEISIAEPKPEDPEHRKILMQVNADKKILEINTDGEFNGTIDSPALTTTKGTPAVIENYNYASPTAYPISTLYNAVSLTTDSTIENVSSSTYKKPISKAGKISANGKMLTLGTWSVSKSKQGSSWTQYATTTVPAGCNYINVTLTIRNDFGGTGGSNIEIWRGGSRIVNQTYSGSASSTKSASYTYNVQPGDVIYAYVRGYLWWGSSTGYVNITYRARGTEKSLFFIYNDGTSEYVPYNGYTSTPTTLKGYTTSYSLYTAGSLRTLLRGDFEGNKWISCLSGSDYTIKSIGGSSSTVAIIAFYITSNTIQFMHSGGNIISLAVWDGSYKSSFGLFETIGTKVTTETTPSTIEVVTITPKDGSSVGSASKKFQFGYFNALETDRINLLPAGMVMAFPVNKTPEGWLKCEGGAISRTTYSHLFEAIGTTYGAGNGSTTFNLPDFRGRFLRGYGGNSGSIGSAQADAIKSHTHSFGFVYGSGSGSSGLAIGDGNLSADGSVGAFGGTETRPLNYAVYWMIKY